MSFELPKTVFLVNLIDAGKNSILKKGNRDWKWKVCKQVRDQKTMETS